MKNIKNKIARTFAFIGKLTAFSFLMIASFGVCCLLGSWSTDNNGNLISDNVFNKDSIYSYNGFYNNNLQFVSNSSYNVYELNVSPNTDYTFYYQYGYAYGSIVDLANNRVVLSLREFSINNLYTFNTVNATKLYLSINKTRVDDGLIMIYKGSSYLSYEPYGAIYYSSENYESLQENYYTLEDDFDSLRSQYDALQDEYNSLEDQANQWYLEKRHLEDAYNELANTIDFSQYSIDLVHYNSSDTLSDNYNVIYSIDDISSLIVSNSFLDINALKRYILALNPPITVSNINGFIINSSVALSIAQYNLLFNALSSPDYYIGLYYSNSSANDLFVSYPLRVFNSSSQSFEYYLNSYSLYDVLHTQNFNDLFSDFTYNKIAFHLTSSNSNITDFSIRNIKLNSENGYNTGYSKGLLDSSNTIASLQNSVNDLQRQKAQLNDNIEYLQRQLDNNLGWHSLFFSMADTPIKVVSGFLNYEILGINLFKALLGILTALAVIWLIKRFTR